MKIGFGVMVNSFVRLDMVLKQSEIDGTMHFVEEPESATKGLNRLLGIIEAEHADVAVLTHQDMDYRSPWLAHIQNQIGKLPDSWIVAGIIGKDMQGRICGRFHDTRITPIFDTSDLHVFPQPASCFDECCILVNLAKGFRFDETLDGFDLYGTLCVLQAWEVGGTAWILDSGAYSVLVNTKYGECRVDFALAQHRCMLPFTWFPDERFCRTFKWLHDRFPKAARIDSTVLGVPKEQEAAIGSENN